MTSPHLWRVYQGRYLGVPSQTCVYINPSNFTFWGLHPSLTCQDCDHRFDQYVQTQVIWCHFALICPKECINKNISYPHLQRWVITTPNWGTSKYAQGQDYQPAGARRAGGMGQPCEIQIIAGLPRREWLQFSVWLKTHRASGQTLSLLDRRKTSASCPSTCTCWETRSNSPQQQ